MVTETSHDAKRMAQLLLKWLVEQLVVALIIGIQLAQRLLRDKKRRIVLIAGAMLLICAISRARQAVTANATAAGYSGSSAQQQADAFKAYQDYQYVKYRGPVSGPLYRSTKW